MNPFISFMASRNGRLLRVVVGAALVVWGFIGIGGAGGVILGIVGLVPLLAGILDYCVFAPLFGNPIKGADIRRG
ncbi:MAG: YgaP family membrane protein [Anaerolineae bacterium]